MQTRAFLASLLLFTAPPAFCIPITATIQTTFLPATTASPQTDTLGIFGPIGKDLSGADVTVTYTYLSDDFYPFGCGLGCLFYYDSARSAQNVISITVNGQTLSVPGKDQTQLSYSFPPYPSPYQFAESVLDYDVPIAPSLILRLPQPATFGQPIASTPSGIELFFQKTTFSSPYETLELTPVASTTTPEPPSLLLALSGMAGALALRSRREP